LGLFEAIGDMALEVLSDEGRARTCYGAVCADNQRKPKKIAPSTSCGDIFSMKEGFRAALFHRLAGYQLFIPPLRERRDDVGRLLIHFLREELQTTGDLDKLLAQREAQRLWLPTAVVARLARYAWPGNVRQLRNAARQLAISSRGADEVRIDPALVLRE
jgi:transcriptional regulator with AAA-type ATPase domain